jgi:hypothetical protein
MKHSRFGFNSFEQATEQFRCHSTQLAGTNATLAIIIAMKYFACTSYTI